MQHPEEFEVIVVGGGHAGTEAALASARMGARTLLLTQSIETLGQMSCNPAIGGIGKGHLAREIDALGGAMARAADAAGIHFRTLNARKGPAVRATRAQADRALYRAAIRRMVDAQPKLALFQQSVADLVIEGERVAGVVTAMGLVFRAPAVVLTVGTFLGGRIHIGESGHEGGRAGDPPSNRLAARLRELPLRVGRLKTGTPPRLAADTLDFDAMRIQPGDEPRPVFSFLGARADHPRQLPCWITGTTERTHDIIRAALHRSPMHSGAIEGAGPRYCPSVEDKISRFADKSSHQVFVEPEGLEAREVYPNGISTSLPFDVQYALVRSIPGFERAHITRPGYAIEYDYFDPRDLRPTLETHQYGGLFFAGQINGTTGYEEAGAQGLLAGVNAVRGLRGEAPWVPARHEAYIGVLADDLVTRGASEPYRMFTSRAEYRLLLREDNADERLTPQGRALGLVDDERWARFEAKQAAVEREVGRLAGARMRPESLSPEQAAAFPGELPSREVAVLELLRRPGVGYQALLAAGCIEDTGVAPEVAERIEIHARYDGYIRRQQAEVERQRRHESAALPDDLDYAQVRGLSHEARQRLAEARPATLGQAARLAGVTPAAISLLLVHLKRRDRADRVA